MLNGDISNVGQPTVSIDADCLAVPPRKWWQRCLFRIGTWLGAKWAVRWHRIPFANQACLFELGRKGWSTIIIGIGWDKRLLERLFESDWVGMFLDADDVKEAATRSARMGADMFFTNKDRTGTTAYHFDTWDDVFSRLAM